MALIDARRKSWIPAALAAMSLALMSSALRAQSVTLPAGITSTIQLSEADAGAIKTFVDASTPDLSGSDPTKVHNAMDALRSPFSAANIRSMSISFRHRYSDALMPTLQGMITPALLADGSSDLPVRALSVAGELGTDDAADLLVAQIDAQRADVRYQAAYGLRRTFYMVNNNTITPIMTDTKVASLIKAIGARAATETDPLVLDGLIRALDEAGKSDAARPQVVRVLGGAISTNFKSKHPSAQPAEAAALVRAALAMRGMLSDPAAIPASDVRVGAEMAGQLAAYAARAVNDKVVSAGGNQELRRALADLATASQNAVLVAYSKLNIGQQAPKAAPLGDTLRTGTVANDAQFVVDVGSFVNDVLAKAPYNFPASSFQLK